MSVMKKHDTHHVEDNLMLLLPVYILGKLIVLIDSSSIQVK